MPPHQLARARPIRCRSPRQPQFRGPLANLVRRFRKALDIHAKEPVERLDFNVEPFHHPNRHRAQIRKATADRHLRNRIPLRADGRQKFRGRIDEPGREIVPSPDDVRVLW